MRFTSQMGYFLELDQLEPVLESASRFARIEQLATIQVTHKRSNIDLPMWGLTIGSNNPAAPTLVLTAGVHGLERVGTHVVIHFLKPLIESLQWDELYQDMFSRIRLAVIPIVNPGGMLTGSRCNPNDVDIMRNAPLTGNERGLPLVSGHRYSRRLPWYQGPSEGVFEKETQALIHFVKTNAFQSRLALALDVHSGFGMTDRLWYPWSSSREIIPDIQTVERVSELLKLSHPFHFYKVEKQTDSYVIHGDPWDYLYAEHLKQKGGSTFIPWTLEMGSWTWLRKNPGQFFMKDGMYNPVIPHRYNRTMRRHRPLLEFLLRLLYSHETITSPSSKTNLLGRS